MIKNILLATLLLTNYTASYALIATYESRSDDALTCSAIFSILTATPEPKELNTLVTKLAIIMRSVYVNLEKDFKDNPPSNRLISEIRDKRLLELGKLYDKNSEDLVNEYIQCNAWRADISEQIQNNKPLEEVMKNPPIPHSMNNIILSEVKREVVKNQLVTAMRNWDDAGRITSQNLKSYFKSYLEKSISSKNKATLKKHINLDKDNSSPWLSLAKKGDAKAQFELGYDYLMGTNIPKILNEEEGTKWWREYGKKEGIKWILKSANQGYADAQYDIGHKHYFGLRGVEKNIKEAVKWFKKSANQGQVEAQYALGLSYFHGRGMLKDDKEAVKWYRKAAEQGDADAQFNLGTMYAYGDGVLKDLSKAKYWIKKAYENPDVSASTRELVEKAWNQLELWKY